MSIAALNWAWSQECPTPTSKLVLLALADKANDDGECWPGMSTVAEMAGVSVRQVSTHLARLEDEGLLVRRRKRNARGWLGSYTFHLNVPTGSTLPVESQEKQAATGSTLPVGDQGKPTSGSTLPLGRPIHRKSSVTSTGSRLPHKEQPPKSNPHKPLATEKPSRRKPDPIFDAVIEACGLDPSELTKSARGAANRAVKELRDIGASPEGIVARAKVHRQRWPHAECTPSSLSKNYAQLNAKPSGTILGMGGGVAG